jgi:site-specific DNA-methyltransferase (adenine-specific)
MRKRIADGGVTVVVTSPPYNLGVKYKSYNDRRSAADYLAWMDDVAVEVKRVLAGDGSFFLNVGSTPQEPWRTMDVALVMRKHFVLQNQIIWVKSIAIPRSAAGKNAALAGDVAVGHFKPINSPRYLNHCHEFIFHLTKKGDVPLSRLAVGIPYQDKSNVRRWKSARADRRCRGNTWFIPYRTIQSRDKQRPHPSTFPVELADMCVRLHGVEKIRLAMDPFLGLGSTALACQHLGVPFIGFEIDPEYAHTAEKLLKQTQSVVHGPSTMDHGLLPIKDIS